jgi:signal transduction histidine kinase
LKTIGARLTVIYVSAVAGTLIGIFFLGRYLLRDHLVETLDQQLAATFREVSDRLGAGTDNSRVEAALFFELGVRTSPIHIETEDLWNDPVFRAARTSGAPLPPPAPPRFYDGTDSRGEAVRIYEASTESLRVKLSAPLAPTDAAVGAYSRRGLVVIATVLVLSTAAGALLSRAALRPLRAIQATAARISSDNLSERIPVADVQDEIANLARLLNATFDRLEASFEQIKRFSADASHELKTPLSLVRLNLERIILHENKSDATLTAVQESVEQIDALTRLIERLLFLSRVEAGEVQLDCRRLNPQRLIDSFSLDAAALAEARGIHFAVATSEPGMVSVDCDRIRQVLLNLVSNALNATHRGGHVRLHSEFRDKEWRVSIVDDGKGLEPSDCQRVFERFVRVQSGQQSQAGAGLGLAISRSIVTLHGGRIVALSEGSGKGARFLFAVPECNSA